MSTIHFEHSNRWGHALHAFTWQKVPPRSMLQRVHDWWTSTRRYKVMCHCSQFPVAGDIIVYAVHGGTARAKIYHVEPCGDPEDMFTLFILRDRLLDEAFNNLNNEAEYNETDLRQVSEILPGTDLNWWMKD